LQSFTIKKGRLIMSRKYYLLLCMAFVAFSDVCVFGQDKDPNAAEALRHYKESLSYLQSVSMEVDVESSGKRYDPNSGHGRPRRKANYIFRCDRGRTEWVGQSLLLDHLGNVDPVGSRRIQIIITKKCYFYVLGAPEELPSSALMIINDYEDHQKRAIDAPELGGPLGGRIFGNNHKSVAELLSESTNLYLRKEQENINGVPCYVLEARTKHGKVTAWVAPEKGYSTLKWMIHKTNDDLFDDRPISLNSWLAVFDAVEVRQANDVFTTTGGILTLTFDYPDGRKVSWDKYKVSGIQLNPDFEALGAFKIDLPNGTRVTVEDSPGIRYVWQDGEIVPADDPTFEEIDKIVDELKQ